MRDPLRNVSVTYKLAFAFLGVCLLAFGVGGYLVSSSARASLEREIRTHLSLRSQFHATMFSGGLSVLRLRVRDFASDGFIRTRFEALEEADYAAALREHLRENKLPLEQAFEDLALVRTPGRQVFLADPLSSDWAAQLPDQAFGTEDWFSGLIEDEQREGPPMIVITTPLWNLDGDRVIGTLAARINSGVWIAAALAATRTAGEEPGPEFGLQLRDAAGQRLKIPRAWVLAPPEVASREAHDALELRIREPQTDLVRPPLGAVLAQDMPLTLGGWSLETSLNTHEALAAVAGLQARFLFVGIALTLVACVLLLFPMRFLVGPLGRLKDAAVHFREGDLTARVPVESTDEIGELSQSFNEMAEAVEGRTEELRATADSLEQRRNELSRERDRLNAVIHSMRDGLMVLDADGEAEVWNTAAEPLLEVLRSGGLELSAHRNCLRAGEGELPMEVSAEDHPCLGCLFDVAAPPRSCLINAGALVFEVHSTNLAADATGRSGRVLVARDITDRVAEDERQIHQERLAALGEVAAVMAHELNNPLAAIKMFTQMIESKLSPDSPLREDITVIERNTQTCTRTIRELLDYATGATPEVGPVDVHACLSDVSSFLRAFRERKSVELVLELAASDPVVVGDEVQLRQVFVNLVMNAMQAVGEGEVHVSTWLDGSHLVIDVRDTGPGIDSDVGDTVFRPFFTTKPRGSGTGLGLSTARRITEIQGGGLDLVDGRPGQTTFRVRLLRGTS